MELRNDLPSLAENPNVLISVPEIMHITWGRVGVQDPISMGTMRCGKLLDDGPQVAAPSSRMATVDSGRLGRLSRSSRQRRPMDSHIHHRTESMRLS